MTDIVTNYIFHKELDGTWAAVTRDNFFDLFNNRDKVKFRSNSTKTLEEMINRTGGDTTQLDSLNERAGCTVPEIGDHFENY